MKRLILIILSGFFVLQACKHTEPVLPDSIGKINSLLVVVDNKDWKGPLGDTLRHYFARDYDVLPQREPLFSITQIPPESFNKNLFIYRNILVIRYGKNSGIKMVRDKYAEPQLIVIVEGKDRQDVMNLLHRHADRIIRAFQKNETDLIGKKEFRKTVSDSLIRKELHISIRIPDYYKLIVHKDGFFWYRHDLKFGSKNILLYKIPLKDLDSLSAGVVKMRDSIGKSYIPGPMPGSYMITERSFSPVQYPAEINGMKGVESRGLWEMEKDYMAGPYVNYILPLPKHNVAVVLEGFVYLPSENKRNLMTELQAILQTARPID
ncbi:MAG: DUF4837 family protein [Chlorobi bacterium]|nr:DUF4837 family protein [Chlorobiota bacterium]